MKYSIFTALFVSTLVFVSFAEAQTVTLPQTLPNTTKLPTINVNPQEIIPKPVIDITMSPENPGPNQLVQISIVSYGTDINAASVSWQLNGVTKLSGKGKKDFSFTTGGTNVTTTLIIFITTREGDNITKTVKIRPAGVDLMWQSEGFVPPFYKGKSMFSHQNKMTFIAIPHVVSGGVEVSPKNLIYKWTRNGTVSDTDSGYGKNTLSFTSPLVSRPQDVKVEVSSLSTGAVGDAEIIATPDEPTIIFYKKNPLYGVEFQKALGQNELLTDSKEVNVIGEPFFFGTTDISSQDLVYSWAINGNSIGNDPTDSTEIFRQKEGSSGTSNISLRIEDTRKILQVASTNFNLTFGNNTGQ